ncbi:hypothetical protein Scep_001518 [Stephania cephalantha]|uniref:Uncharacterized protein n=1 Tax=Stephania cephalantha TaxID=152367 RepID=A0AAP0Q3F3_9MAGN
MVTWACLGARVGDSADMANDVRDQVLGQLDATTVHMKNSKIFRCMLGTMIGGVANSKFHSFGVLVDRWDEKLLDFGRKDIFHVRVLSRHEERRIMSYRLELQTKTEQAQAKKEPLRKILEQAILAEVCRMVEQMQTLNRSLDETVINSFLGELLQLICYFKLMGEKNYSLNELLA